MNNPSESIQAHLRTSGAAVDGFVIALLLNCQ